jgi:hypothetical protein
MVIEGWAEDFGFAEGAERDDYAGLRRSRIRDRFEFHKNRFSESGSPATWVTDLEPIESVQVQSALNDDEAARQQAKLHRGNIINIQI